jgi:hypothetical protein
VTYDPTMTFRPGAEHWLSTAECARSIGVSDWWIRERIEAGILPATAIRTGHRKVFKVRASDWVLFVARYTGPATDPRFGG